MSYLRGWLLSAALFAVLLVVLSAASRTEPASDPASVWNRVPDREVVFGGEGNQEMESVTVGGPGLVAVGLDSSGGDWDAAVWTSVDGVSWSRVAHDELVFGGVGDQAMESVTVGGPGLVAVGLDFSGGDEDAAVWTSADGLIWSRVAHDEAVFGGVGDQEMESVTAGGPGLVAVGLDFSGGDEDAAVWTSADGLIWSRVAHDEAVFGGVGDQEMESVTVGGPGLVAVGWEVLNDVDAAVWTSVDGLSWMRVADDEAVFGGVGDQEMEGVTAGGPGLVAVGLDAPGGDVDAAVWTSADGVIWSRVAHDEAVFGGNAAQEMESVTVGGPGLVAVGLDAFGGYGGAAVWTSVDGLGWMRVADDEAIFGGNGAQAMESVTAGGPGLVAVGVDYAGGDSDVAAWVWVFTTEESG